ncbi:MAG TPA: DHHA1 domain-containing protein [Candidatus Paceibacterota bacterium]|nr:DHHA1 domain-containing protein [Candidatus Paceibacterota bacterium]
MLDIIVFYHKNCSDGFGSAWVTWKKFKKKAEYIPFNYQAPFDYEIKGKKIYFLDVCPNRKILENLKKNDCEIVIIDHHLSAKRNLDLVCPGSFIMRLNMKRAAAILTWKYFFPEKRIPKLLLYIEDIDLWKFKKRFSREIVASINLSDLDFKEWDKLVKDIEDVKKRKGYILEGKKIVEYQNEMIEQIMGDAKKIKLGKIKTLAVNSSFLISEIGDALIKKLPPIAVVWFEAGDKKRISLRSNGKVDVSKIAEKYGGGGHKCAAGFAIKSEDPFPWEK